jgi:hypothetical protein
MFCPNCGTNVPEGSKFCVSCGSSMQQPEEANEQLNESIQQQKQEEFQPQQQPEPQQQPAPQPQSAPQQQTQYQQQYQPIPQQPANNNNVQPRVDIREKVYGVGGWFLTLLLLCIPIVNIILTFVWAFSGSVNKNKKNFAIALLIMMAISLVISIVLYASIAAMIGNIFDSIGGGFSDF